jgi:23S rRNA (adenine-N6)-dimethyltransferase
VAEPRPVRAPRAGGQHFLRSPRLAAALVRDASIESTDLVVDLGAGSGRLTAALADRAGRVHAIELDPLWAARLRDRFADRPNVSVIEADAARWRLPEAPFSVVANVPFDRTTAILRHLLDDPRLPLRQADLIVEWGVALKRSARWPSTMLNVLWGAWYEIALVRRLPAALFEPKPRVDAGLLRFVRRPEPLVPDSDGQRFSAFLEHAFTGRGQALRQTLASFLSPRELKRLARELGFDPSAAARDLDLYQWTTLFGAVRTRR